MRIVRADVMSAKLMSTSKPTLAIQTDKWHATTDQEQYAYAIFERQRPLYKIERTDKTKPIAFDAWILHDTNRVAMVETKCREMLYEEFVDRYGSKWLLSESKLAKLSLCARQYKRPAYGFLYFINCKKLLTLQLVSASGRIIERESKLVTSAEKYLGGVDTRQCALVQMRTATILQWHGRPVN